MVLKDNKTLRKLLDTIKPDNLIIELGDVDENIIVRKQVAIVDGELEIIEALEEE